MTDHGPDVDISSLYTDGVMERELREATKSESEIELFKIVQQSMRIRAELANSETVKKMVAVMWTNVAEFFESVTEAKTLANLSHDDDVVCQHQRMLANFAVVADLNQILKAGKEAEVELVAVDHMDQFTEEPQ